MTIHVYHFTHRDNLRSILRAGGLHCDARMAGRAYAQVGNPNIKGRRTRRTVPLAPGGMVADYVPFYFAPRSPMLYAIHMGNVPGCHHGQDEVVYLITDAGVLFNSCACCYTDRNAVLNHARFGSDPTKLPEFIDWPLMRARMWKNTADDLERIERRMAEFLVHRFVPWSLVRALAVYDDDNLDYVQSAFVGQPAAPTISVRRDWFF